MKATDLMLNDLVMCNNKVCKVCSIEGVMILVSFKDGEKLTIEDTIEPITLTPEILEKNGFYHETNVGLKFDDGCGGIVICDTWNKRVKVLYNYNIVYDSEYTLFCVHSLQHILKLCQIDKEIKL